jgi:hypothetical protein
MSGPAVFSHPLLRAATPAAWIAAACALPELLLIDHANCEKKAASTALALMFAYAEDLELTDKMSRLAREELRHYEQVARLIGALKIVPQRLAPGRYAAQLRRLVASEEPAREVDLMICGAFIGAHASASPRWERSSPSRWMSCSSACTKLKRGTISSIWSLRHARRRVRALGWMSESRHLPRARHS